MDFFFIYLIVYFAMITGLMTVFYGVYRYSVPRVRKVLKNDIPHYIEHLVSSQINTSIPKIQKKLFHMTRSQKGTMAKQDTSNQPKGLFESILGHPAVQEGIGNMIGSMMGNFNQPPGGRGGRQ